MTNEIPATAPGGGSNKEAGLPAQAPHAGSSPEPEARIIEEIIIKPPQHSPAEKLPATSENVQTPPASTPPEPVQQIPKTPEVPAPAAEPPPPLPPSYVAGDSAQEQKRISSILEEIKLPKRRSSPPQAKTPEQSPNVFDTALGAVETKSERQGPPAPQPPPPPPQSDEPAFSIVSPLRTLKNDLQEVVREKKISLVRAVALEQEKRRDTAGREFEHMQASPRRHTGVLFSAVLLLVLGGAALGGVYFIMSERSEAPTSTADSSILFVESTVSLPLESESPLELKRLLAQARGSSNATLGSITRIVPTERITTEEGGEIVQETSIAYFWGRMGAQPPEDLLRALSSEFFFGIHTVDENAPIFVIPVLSYERAFAGMLAWEQGMNADLSPVFTTVPPQIIGPSGLPEKRGFEDVIMRNYDVRALKDDAGDIQLFYSFPTRSILVIGESPYSFTEVLSRLRAERKL